MFLYKSLPMTGFEPQTSGIGNDWATTTAPLLLIFKCLWWTVWPDLAKVTKSMPFFTVFLIWPNAEPTLANLCHYWANFKCCKWPNIKKPGHTAGGSLGANRRHFPFSAAAFAWQAASFTQDGNGSWKKYLQSGKNYISWVLASVTGWFRQKISQHLNHRGPSGKKWCISKIAHSIVQFWPCFPKCIAKDLKSHPNSKKSLNLVTLVVAQLT